MLSLIFDAVYIYLYNHITLFKWYKNVLYIPGTCYNMIFKVSNDNYVVLKTSITLIINCY